MGLSGAHIFLIVIVLLVFFGPSRLPSLGKSVGEAIRGFKKGMEGDEIDVTKSAHSQLPPSDGQNQNMGSKTGNKTDA